MHSEKAVRDCSALQRHDFGGAQPVPIGHQKHQPIARPFPLCGVQEAQKFNLSQMLHRCNKRGYCYLYKTQAARGVRVRPLITLRLLCQRLSQ